MKTRLLVFILSVIFSIASQAEQRIISAGGAITELIYALGVEKQLVAVDTSSVYPDSVKRVPKVGYHRSLSLEGTLSLKPTLLLGSAEMGPPNVVQQLRGLGVNVQQLPTAITVQALTERITKVAALVGEEEKGKVLLQTLNANQHQLIKQVESVKKPLKALFLVQHSGRSPMVAGSNTSANTLMQLAGLINPALESIQGYRQLSSESLVDMQPEVIIVPDHMVKKASDLEKLLALLPGLKETPAGKANRIITVDSSLLVGGLGPRIVTAAQKLAVEVYPELQATVSKTN